MATNLIWKDFDLIIQAEHKKYLKNYVLIPEVRHEHIYNGSKGNDYIIKTEAVVRDKLLKDPDFIQRPPAIDKNQEMREDPNNHGVFWYTVLPCDFGSKDFREIELI